MLILSVPFRVHKWGFPFLVTLLQKVLGYYFLSKEKEQLLIQEPRFLFLSLLIVIVIAISLRVPPSHLTGLLTTSNASVNAFDTRNPPCLPRS
jgi:hypothetical protein